MKQTIRVKEGEDPELEELNEPFRLPTPRYEFLEDKGKEQEANPLKKGIEKPKVERIPTPESKVFGEKKPLTKQEEKELKKK